MFRGRDVQEIGRGGGRVGEDDSEGVYRERDEEDEEANEEEKKEEKRDEEPGIGYQRKHAYVCVYTRV